MLALVLRPDAHVYDTPLTEDAYYALAVARNVAAGRGITIDGVHATNGFQPLFTFMEAGSYWLADGDEVPAIRLILALSFAIFLATATLVGRIAADLDGADAAGSRTRFWLAFLLYFGGFLAFMHHFNGLETGLVMLGYASLARAHQCGWMERRFGPSLFGAALGLLVLTRIDAGFFAAIFILFHVARRWREAGLARAIRHGLALGLPAVIVASPWFLYNLTVFGSPMPTSGTAQQEWGLVGRRWLWLGWALAVAAMPSTWLGRLDEIWGNGIALSLLRAAIFVGMAILFRRSIGAAGPRASTDPRRGRALVFAGLMLATFAALSAYYVLSFTAYWFYYRYLFPVALPATVAIAWLLAPRIEAHARAAIVASLLLATPTLISAVMARGGRTLHVQTVYWDQLALIRENVPGGAKVAAGQAGTLGYFYPAAVNMDGKVNGEVIRYQDRGWVYLEETGVVWFCDWPYYVERYLGRDPHAHGWRRVATRGIWELWRRDE